GDGLGSPNAGSTRPFNIAKFSELYFIAAEAAVKGAATSGQSARDLINVIRARAGKWRWDNNGNEEKIEDHSAEMVSATPGTITIDYILAERSREYYGEGYRWFDLVRTQKWQELAGSYEIAGPELGNHTPETFTRTIEDYHYLRPIPQGQLEGMEMTEAEIEAYQNPGYREHIVKKSFEQKNSCLFFNVSLRKRGACACPLLSFTRVLLDEPFMVGLEDVTHRISRWF